jgi:type II secretory pathway component GspD/PulD (secretin)
VVAVHKKTTGIRLATGTAWVVVLAALFFSAAPASAQERPLRARAAWQQANEAYSRGEYEKAAKLCVQAQALKQELTENERRDLEALIRRNNAAVQGRKDGQDLVNKAYYAYGHNRTTEASGLLNKAKANQYLAPTDRARLNDLDRRLRSTTVRTAPQQPRNYKTLMSAASKAYKAGDLDGAEQLALEAKPLEPAIMFPWAERADHILNLVRQRRQQMQQMNPAPPKKEKAPFNLKNIFKLPGQSDPADNTNTPTPAGNSVAPTTKVSQNAAAPANNNPANVAVQQKPIQTVAAPTPTSLPRQADQPISVVSRSTAMPSAPSDPAANTEQARQLVKQGYQVLQAGEYERARQLAIQAQELRPNLEWWEMNPEKLLADIQRRAPGRSMAGSGKTSGKLPASERAATSENAKGDAHALLKRARVLYGQKLFDEAERLCAQAAAAPNAHWGLFEDSPDKLRADINKTRGARDRDDAARLLTEARKLYSQGNYQEAKTKAWRAQQLHGPYNIWDLGDRPQRLLADIERAERKQGIKTPDSKQSSGQAGSANTFARNSAGQRGTQIPPNPLGRSNKLATDETRTRTLALMAEARDLMRRGMLVEARERALTARQLNVTFAPEGDSPDLVLQELNLYCSRQIDALLQRADDSTARLADSARFQKAEADLAAARVLATAFGQDVNRIDQKVALVQQMQGSGGAGVPSPVQQVAGTGTGMGHDLLDKARRELKAGNTRIARQLAVDAFDAKYGVQTEAAAVLRSIDIEEHNQQILAAHRNAEAAVNAFKRRDFRAARGILAGVDPRLLNPQMQRLVREMAATKEMQPDGVTVAKGENPVPAGPNAPGKVTVEDFGPGDAGSDLANYQAMEAVIYEKLLTDSREVQNKARSLVQSGDVGQAVELLRDHLEQLNRSQVDPAKLALLRGQVDNRLQQYRILQARMTIEAEQKTQQYAKWSERDYQKHIGQHQEEVADLLKQYRGLMKEGKYNEARTAALKAKEMDPDNVAADAAIRIATIEARQKTLEMIKTENDARFLDELDARQGPAVSMDNPLFIDKERLKVASKRGELGTKGIWSPSHSAKEREIERRLDIPKTVNFQNEQFKRIIEDLHSLSGINIVADEQALSEQNISLEMPMSLSVEDISMRNILDILLRKAHLTYVIRNEVLNITTENNAKGRLKQVTYPVTDLVVPLEEAPDLPSVDRLLEEYRSRMAGVSTANTPFLNQFALPNGQTVSSSSSSSTGAPAAQGSMTAYQQGLTGRRSSHATIEEQLISLITNTIAPETWKDQGGPGTIQYFPLGMALVINQTQDVQEQIQDLLQALRRLQDLEVAVELRLVSVSEAFFERIGVDFSVNLLTHNSQAAKNELVNSSFQPFGLPNSFQPSGFVSGLTPAGTFTPDLNIPIKTGSFGLSTPPFGSYPGTLTTDGGISLGLAFLSDIQVYMFMEAAQGDRRLNVMQAPKVTVFNGQTALIAVNEQQFFMLSITPSFTPFGNLIFTPNNVPFPLGVTLRVTPVVSADRRFVRLNLVPTMTNLTSATVPLFPVQFPVPLSLFGPGNLNTQGPPEGLFQMFFQQPSITTITVSTTVNVPDGGTVLMGGLKTLSEGRSEFGPPILSKIPYINRLFKNVGYGREAESLMLMVTPRIIINEEEEMVFRGQVEPIPRP